MKKHAEEFKQEPFGLRYLVGYRGGVLRRIWALDY